MKVACLAFTEKGYALACRLAQELGGTAQRSGQPLTLHQWTQTHFPQEKALIYVGAVGIAVRAIAPYLQGKTQDPAVVAVDECARFAVPLVSGHLGGANDLARRVACICGAEPVITTATDANGVFAVDAWARIQHCAVLHVPCIRRVSGALLAGRTIRIKTEFPIEGMPPEGVALETGDAYDVYVGFAPQPSDVLWLIPQFAVLGIGCRKGTACPALETAFQRLPLPEQAICGVASIDLKASEPGLLEFCQQHEWPLQTYSATALNGVQGNFTASSFVSSVTGVDNVCERAAVLASGGSLIIRKMAGNGVTMAAAVKPVKLDWRYHDEW